MSRSPTTYPWGHDKPSNRLRKVSARLRSKLDEVA